MKNLFKNMLAVFMLVGVFTLKTTNVNAEAVNSYPVEKGEESLTYAPTLTGGSFVDGGTNKFQMIEYNFATSNQKIGTIDQSSVGALVIQMEIIKVTPIWRDFEIQPGFVTENGEFSVCDSPVMNNSQGKLLNIFQFMDEENNISNFNGQYFNALINETFEGKRGLFIFNTDYFANRWGNSTTLKSAFIRFDMSPGSTGAEVKIGEIGYLEKGYETINKDTYHTLISISQGEPTFRFDKADTNSTLVLPSDKPVELPELVQYPFAKGDNHSGFKGATTYYGPKTKYSGSGNNYNTLFINFPTVVDLSKASYVAIQYWANQGAPGLTYGLENGNARYSIVGHDGANSYMVKEDGKVTVNNKYLYDSSNVGGYGMLLIPLNDMSWQFGSDEYRNKSAFKNFLFTTNSVYNYDFSFTIGEVGYYTGSLGDASFTYHKILGIDENHNKAFFVTSDDSTNIGHLDIYNPIRTTYGDVEVVFNAHKKVATDFPVWDGGAIADVAMDKDSYGNDAVKITPVGLREGKADPYAAVTLENVPSYDWANKKGIAFWARNDSNSEAVFNIEIDLRNPNWNSNTNARFNINGGYRFFLYDVNTDKQEIMLSHPTVTLPVNFEGWVYMPFDSFKQAEWSVSSVGAMPADYSISNGILAENTKVTYLAITVQTQTYANLSFTVNNFGAYSINPTMNTALVKGNSIKDLLDLPVVVK